jgi:hypothetical protein
MPSRSRGNLLRNLRTVLFGKFLRPIAALQRQTMIRDAANDVTRGTVDSVMRGWRYR